MFYYNIASKKFVFLFFVESFPQFKQWKMFVCFFTNKDDNQDNMGEPQNPNSSEPLLNYMETNIVSGPSRALA